MDSKKSPETELEIICWVLSTGDRASKSRKIQTEIVLETEEE